MTIFFLAGQDPKIKNSVAKSWTFTLDIQRENWTDMFNAKQHKSWSVNNFLTFQNSLPAVSQNYWFQGCVNNHIQLLNITTDKKWINAHCTPKQISTLDKSVQQQYTGNSNYYKKLMINTRPRSWSSQSTLTVKYLPRWIGR